MRGSKHSSKVHKKSREAHKEENAFKNWHHEHRCQNERYKSWEYSSLHHWRLGSRGRNVKDYKTKLTKCKKKKKKTSRNICEGHTFHSLILKIFFPLIISLKISNGLLFYKQKLLNTLLVVLLMCLYLAEISSLLVGLI